MTAHTHTSLIPGCYRCELNKDEVTAPSSEREQVEIRWSDDPVCEATMQALDHIEAAYALLTGLNGTVAAHLHMAKVTAEEFVGLRMMRLARRAQSSRTVTDDAR